jgi:hypothetical protein
MAPDRTPQPSTPKGLGLLPRRGLITRRPGSAGPLPLIIGAAIVVASVVFFLDSLHVERTTFDFGLADMTERWNAASAATTPLLEMDEPSPRPDESGDLVFAHVWSEELTLRGRIDEPSGRIVELTVIGDPDVVDGALIVDAMDLLIRVTEPHLDAAARLETLQELGVVGGDPTPDLRATRGDTDYVVAGAATGSAVGMSAAPFSNLTTDRP